MQYGIIFEVNAVCIQDTDRPPQEQIEAGLWEQTEDGKSEEHDDWDHEKWAALLETDEQFQEFMNHVCLHFDGEGDALGAPMPSGGNLGFTPAFVFTHTDDDGEAELEAYVTPYPMPGEDIPGVNTFKRLPLFGNTPFNGRDVKRIGRHLLEVAR